MTERIKANAQPKLSFSASSEDPLCGSCFDTYTMTITRMKSLKSKDSQISLQAQSMLFENDDIQLLIQLGFTETQAKIYLILLKTGKTSAAMLQKLTKIARPIIYVTLEELHQKGLVEKGIALPNYYRAISVDFALQSLVQEKKETLKQVTESTKEFVRKFQEEKEETVQVQDYRFIIMTGKATILRKMKQQHDNARLRIDILSTLPRWIRIVDECFDNYKRALARGVKYRVIAETLGSEVKLSKEVNNLLSRPNFKLKLTSKARETNSAIFDNKEATFNFFPSKTIDDSPLIWTNHPSFLSMSQDQFNTAWESIKTCENPP